MKRTANQPLLGLSPNESLYSVLLNNCPEAFLLIDEDGRMKFQNRSVFNITGFEIEDTYEKSIFDFVHPEDLVSAKGFFMQLFAEPGVPGQRQYRILHKKGHYLWIEGTVTNLLHNPNVNGFIASYKDITKRKEAEQSAAASNSELKKSLAETSDYKYALDASSIVTIVGADGNVKYVNDNFCKVSKFSPDEVIGQNPRLFNSGYHSKEFFKNLWDTVQQGKIWKGEIRNKTKDGSYYWGDTTIVPFLDKENKPVQYLVIRNDITERKEAEQELRIVHERLSFHLENSPLGFIEWDGRLQVKSWSKQYEQIFGWSEEEYTNNQKNGYSQVYEEDLPVVQKMMEQFLSGEVVSASLQNRNYTKDGRLIWCEWFTTVKKDKDGKIDTLLSLVQDITEKKIAEQKIDESEKRFRALIENSSDMLTISDASGQLQYTSPNIFKFLGYKAENFSVAKGIEIIHPDEMDDYVKMFAAVRKNPGKSYVFIKRMKHADGHWIWTEGSATNLLHIPAIKGVITNFRDITEKKLANENLAKTNQELNKLFNTIEEVVYSVDVVRGKITHISPACEKVYGYKPADFLADIQLWYLTTHPDDLEKVTGHHADLMANKQVIDQCRIITKNNDIRWVEYNIVPTLDEKGMLLHVDGITRDITERKEAEIKIKELNENLEDRVSERTTELTEANNALEGFSYSVSHDLRAPLRAVVSFTKIIREEHSSAMAPDVKELFGYIEKSGIRMSGIINDLLTLAKYGREKLKLVPLDMTELFHNVWHNIKRNSPYNTVVELPTLPPVEGDASMIEQVLVNLVSNAVKYSSKKEHPVVQVGFKEENDCIAFFVKDNGAGFDMKHYDRLFGAFQRLHGMSEFEGTGVGLVLVKRIIEKHGGTVWAEAKVGEGATFWFSLPKVVAKKLVA